MLKHKLKKLAFAALSAVVMLAPMASMPARATTINDPQVLRMKQALIQAMIAGSQAQASRQAAQDAAAATSADCNNIGANAAAAANRTAVRHTPPDPTRIIQNTTCFVDVATVQIPIILTGIGWIDAIIQQSIQKFLTGTCQRATGFLSSMQNQALATINNATGGVGGALILSYSQNGLPDLQTLQQSGMNATQAIIQGTVQNYATNTTNSALNTVTGSHLNTNTTSTYQQSLNATINGAYSQGASNWSTTSTQLMCQYGVPDAKMCPLCLDNPTHPSCIGAQPYCDQYPNIPTTLCQQRPSSGGSGSGSSGV